MTLNMQKIHFVLHIMVKSFVKYVQPLFADRPQIHNVMFL